MHSPSPRPIYPPNVLGEECEHLPLPTPPGNSQRSACISDFTVQAARAFRTGREISVWQAHKGSSRRAQVFAKCRPPPTFPRAPKFSCQPPTEDGNTCPGTSTQEALSVKADTASFLLAAATHKDDHRGQGGERRDAPRESKLLLGC